MANQGNPVHEMTTCWLKCVRIPFIWGLVQIIWIFFMLRGAESPNKHAGFRTGGLTGPIVLRAASQA